MGEDLYIRKLLARCLETNDLSHSRQILSSQTQLSAIDNLKHVPFGKTRIGESVSVGFQCFFRTSNAGGLAPLGVDVVLLKAFSYSEILSLGGVEVFFNLAASAASSESRPRSPIWSASASVGCWISFDPPPLWEVDEGSSSKRRSPCLEECGG